MRMLKLGAMGAALVVVFIIIMLTGCFDYAPENVNTNNNNPPPVPPEEGEEVVDVNDLNPAE